MNVGEKRQPAEGTGALRPSSPPARPTKCFREFTAAEVEQTIPECFARTVVAYPDRIAVKTRNATLTYRALNNAANGVAWAVAEQHRQNDAPVALLFEHRASYVVASVGVLKTGRIQVPLEGTFPRAGLRYMLDQSDASVLVTDGANLALAHELSPRAVIDIDRLHPCASAPDFEQRVSPDCAVAIGYTSGSTGRSSTSAPVKANGLGAVHAMPPSFSCDAC